MFSQDSTCPQVKPKPVVQDRRLLLHVMTVMFISVPRLLTYVEVLVDVEVEAIVSVSVDADADVEALVGVDEGFDFFLGFCGVSALASLLESFLRLCLFGPEGIATSLPSRTGGVFLT